MTLFPFVAFDAIALDRANDLLVEWGHQMGPCERPMGNTYAHALYHEGLPVALALTATLITPEAAGGRLTRENTIELARLCACRRDLCRVALRLWRAFVFPTTGRPQALSYQDAALHSGNLYRFDGWQRLAYSRSGTDQRGQRRGRNKWLWVWPPMQEAA